MTRKIKVAIVLEMMGRPKEHLEETMAKLIEAVGKEKGLSVSGKKIHETKKIEDKDENGTVRGMTAQNQLYSTFAEIDLEADDIMALLVLVFKYMPAHIEIISPENFDLNNFEISSLLSELTARLHHYDAIAKTALINNQLITNKLKEVIHKTGYKEEKPKTGKKEESDSEKSKK
jgi:hypothetical protein